MLHSSTSPRKKPVILFDLDEPGAAFKKAHTQIWRERYPNKFFVPPEKITEFYTAQMYPEDLKNKFRKIIFEPGFFRNLPVVPGFVKAVHYTLSQGYEVYICTTPLIGSKYCVQEKIDWVVEHLGPEFEKRIIFTYDKTLVHGMVLIDDAPEIIGVQKVTSWEHIIFDRPHNQHIKGKRRIDWDNFHKVLGF